MNRPASGDRPFDVLRHAVMIFDADGDLRYLPLPDRPSGRGGRPLPPSDPCGRRLPGGRGRPFLGADHFLNDLHRRLSGGHKKVAGHATVHHRFGKSPYGIDENAVIPAGDRAPGIGNPAGYCIHHDQASDAHQDVFVPKALVHSVSNGLKAVFAGNHFLVGLKDILEADIQLRAILAGKRAAFGVLSQRAAPERHRYPAPAFRFQVLPGTANDGIQIVRDPGSDHQLLNFGAERIKIFDVIGIDGLELAVDFHLKAVVVHEPLEGRGGDHKTRGDFQVNAVLDFAEVGHFAARNFGHVLVQGVQGKNPAPDRQSPGLLEDGVDGFFNDGEPAVQQ